MTKPAFRDGEEELITQALSSGHAWFDGITKERLERDGMAPLALPKNERGESLPFSTHEWFGTPSGCADLLPLPEWHAATESRSNAEATRNFPLEMLARKNDNYMNSTFANIPKHREMERKHRDILEIRPADAAARGITTGDSRARVERPWADQPDRADQRLHPRGHCSLAT